MDTTTALQRLIDAVWTRDYEAALDTTTALQRLIDAVWTRDYEAALDATETLLDLLARTDALPEPEKLRFSGPGQDVPHP